jgi:hypothetical protein
VAYFAQRSFTIGRSFDIIAQEHYERAMNLAKERDLQLKEAKNKGTVD